MSKQAWSTLILVFAAIQWPGAGVAQHDGMGSGGMPAGGSMGGAGSLSMPGSGMGWGMDRNSGMSGAMGERRMRAEQLQRAHRELLDFDPHGNLIVRSEIVGVGVTTEALAAAEAAGFLVARRDALGGFGEELVALTPPKGMSTKKALRKLHELAPSASLDYNHIYFESSAAIGGDEVARIGGPDSSGGRIGERTAGLRVGLIDGGVATSHPGLRSLRLHPHGCNGDLVPSAHATAIASRLVAGFDGAESAQAEVFAADVYCGAPTGGSADAIVYALAWIVQEGVPVVNVSLVGPPNLLLERIVAMAVSRGHLIVAAVGNDGAAAPPLYPAAYPGVIAVTGVDRRGKVLLEAGHVPNVVFAAPAADIEAATLPDGYSRVRGTSYAAPIVASRLSLLIGRPESAAAERAVRELASVAVHPGNPGRDPVYGYGCVGCEARRFAAGSAKER